MANEITINVSLASSKGGASISTGTLSDQINMTGTDMGAETGSATTTAALIAAAGSITWASGVMMVVKNLSSTPAENITIGVDNASPPTQRIALIGPGEACFIPGLIAQPYIYGSTTIAYMVWITEK